MNPRFAALVLPVLVGLACADQPAAPTDQSQTISAQKVDGTGLVLNSVTGLSLPLIGQLGDVIIDQAVVTNFAIVENVVGQIVGLQADGVLQLTGGVLGSQVVSEDFTTTVSITSSGSGQCSLITIDLGQISIDALVANVDVPAATLTAQSSGVVGNLLCTLGQALQGLTSAVPNLVGAINDRI